MFCLANREISMANCNHLHWALSISRCVDSRSLFLVLQFYDCVSVIENSLQVLRKTADGAFSVLPSTDHVSFVTFAFRMVYALSLCEVVGNAKCIFLESPARTDEFERSAPNPVPPPPPPSPVIICWGTCLDAIVYYANLLFCGK
jgi:hypothetical protein